VSTEFAFLSQFLKQRSGLDLTPEKQYLLESRLRPVARKHGVDDLTGLVAGIRQGGNRALMDDVVEAMTTNESFFFRDKTPFDQFRETIMPDLIESRQSQRKLRIWCAAASTGQEPYSLAMELREMQHRLSNWSMDIIGTDLSPQVLEKAKAGLYSQFEVQRGLPVQMLVKYFEQKGDMWQVVPQIRAMAEYRVQNLLEDFSSLGRFDVVFCRNVLIYFDPPTKADVLARIRKLLPADGYLVLGASETIIGLTDEFELVQGSRGLYRPKDAAQNAAPRMVAAGGGAVSAIAEPRPSAAGPSVAAPARTSGAPGTGAPLRPPSSGATAGVAAGSAAGTSANVPGGASRSAAPTPTSTSASTPARPAGLIQAGAPVRPSATVRPAPSVAPSGVARSDTAKPLGTPRPAPSQPALSAGLSGAATPAQTPTNVFATPRSGTPGSGASKITPLRPATPARGAAPGGIAGSGSGASINRSTAPGTPTQDGIPAGHGTQIQNRAPAAPRPPSTISAAPARPGAGGIGAINGTGTGTGSAGAPTVASSGGPTGSLSTMPPRPATRPGLTPGTEVPEALGGSRPTPPRPLR
jgi:chemotaxis protein methyltransferase CheR